MTVKFCVSWGYLWEEGEMLREQASEWVRETVHTCIRF